MLSDNPWGEVRVTDPRFKQRYYYSNPSPAHAKVLSEKGWQFNPCGNPPNYYTDDAEVARAALDMLGLDLPEWTGKSCSRVYWEKAV